MLTLLITTAAVLGLLAFFEPCTIATHTLFAVRTNQNAARQRWLALVQLFMSRITLLACVFAATAWLGLSSISSEMAIGMLGGIGAVYLITRKVYLPVPHLEFYRLLPGHDRWPQALKLGLTLPACTLPLVAVVGVLSALNQQPAAALLAGVIFGAMFSLPTLWDSLHGLDAAHRIFLGKAASASPYITALLLWSAAFLIWKTGL